MAEVSFGEWLKRRRKAAGLTQEELAKQINCSASALRKIEAEERRPSEQIVEQLAKVFNIPSADRASFLKFARGNLEAAPMGVNESFPWQASHHPKSESKIHLATFLFTDIEDSTKLWDSAPEKMKSALQRHHVILEAAISSNGGNVFQTMGDAFCAAFPTAPSAISAAVTAQRELLQEPWDLPFPIRVRMGVHTGEAEPNASRTGGYASNPTMNRVARILGAAHGGQVLLSLVTKELLKDSLPANVDLRDMGEHYLRNLVHPEHLFQLDIVGLPSNFPPLNTLSVARHNLPVQLTSFIGRQKEIAAVIRLLEKARIVTLIGPGGTGKTRLSIEVANELLDQYPDGVWIVELAPILDAQLVPRTTAIAMGLREEPQRPVTDMLCDYVRDKQLLLILDNCEHLVEACAQLADRLLHAGPPIRILATSREILGIGGETSYLVPSLKLPDMQNLPIVESLSQFEAIRLFIERASEKTQGFIVTDENASSIAQICHRLDGIPLAIELAAGKIRALSTQQIAQRLDDRFRLLTSGNRTSLPRHQTLRAAIEWSYNLLPRNEQTLFRRLSIFLNGWTLEAAESVCSDKDTTEEDALKQEDILGLLSQLVNKSLVMTEERHAKIRYHTLETVRQYADNSLIESGESNQMRNRHLAYYLDLAEKAEPYLTRTEQVEWLKQLDSEHNNLRAALDWSLRIHEHEKALRIAGALGQFWWVRNHYEEGQEWIRRAAETANNNQARAKALQWGSILARQQGKFQAAKNLSNQSLDLYRRLEDAEGIARALSVLGSIGYFEQELSVAKKAWDEALAMYRQMEDKRGIAFILNNLGLIAHIQGNIQQAQAIFEESLPIFRELEDKWSIARVLLNLGHTAYSLGDFLRARELYDEDLKVTIELGETEGIAYALISLANVLCQEGQHSRSAQIQGAATSILKQMEIYVEPIEQANFDETSASLEGVLGKEVYQKEFETGKQLSMEQAIELALRKASK